MACVHDPRSGQQRYVDANRVIERRPSKTGRGTIWSGDSCGGFAHKQDSIVVTLDQAAFGGEIEYIGRGRDVDATENVRIARPESV